MKFKATYILFFIAFLFSVEAAAQMDRRVGRQQYKRERGTAEKQDVVEKSVEYLAKELKLDDFQKAVVNKIMEEERLALTGLQEDRESTIEERKEKARIISDRIYNKIIKHLSAEQIAKYTKIQDERKF